MNSKDNMRMCTAMDYNHDLFDDDDCYSDILNILDFPVESLEGDGLTEDWASKLGPIPSEVFREMLPPAGPADMLGSIKLEPTDLKTESSDFAQEIKLDRIPKFFDSPSPDSVLESRSSSSTKSVSLGTIPVRTRTKRSKSKVNPWSRSLQLQTIKIKIKMKRKKTSVGNEMKKCSHCEITKTPQWREGPMGPKTLCNACGVRYRSGRLFPEYRPAASPTFIPALHSNSHRKVIELRQKGAKIEDDNYAEKSNPKHTIDFVHELVS